MNAVLNHDHAARFLEDLREPGAPYFSPSAFSDTLHITTQRLAELAKVHRTTTTRSPDAEKLQDYLRGAASVLAIAVELTGGDRQRRSEEQKSELLSLMSISYDVFCWQKKIN